VFSQSVAFHGDSLEAGKGKKFERKKALNVNDLFLNRHSVSRSGGEREVGKTRQNYKNLPSTKKASFVDVTLIYSLCFVSLCVRKILNETFFFFF